MTADTAIGYRVSSDDGATLTTADFRREMLDAGCKAHLLSKEYVSNACRWVVWQQACVARAFPEHLGARGALSKRAVTQRLLYRYERELIRARRPWIRRVMERDTPAGTPAVLVIAAVRRLGGAGGGGGGGAEIEVTDGWYGLAARLDPALSDLLRRGKLHVGQKILVQGAELRGSAEPASPLTDAADELWLALHRNGARPAPWDATLGARRAAATFPLRTIVPNGGNVLRTLVHVERAYPPAWVESGRVDGRTIHRGDAAEARAARAFEAARAEVIERAANDVVLGNGSRYRDDLCDLTDADARREDHEEAVNKTLESKGLLERRVRRCVKLRVSGVRNVEHREARLVGSALLTTYDVDESFLSHVVEGACYELTGDLRPSAFEKAGLELAAGRKTRWRRVSEDALARAGLAPSPTPRKLGGVNDIAAGAVRRGDEFDAVAVLLHASNPMPPDAPRSQWAFALDHTSADGARLLAIEIESRTTEAFASAFEWGAGGGGDKNVHHATVLKFENLTYARRDDENALEVARATEHTRVTVLLPSGSASASAPSSSSAAAAAPKYAHPPPPPPGPSPGAEGLRAAADEIAAAAVAFDAHVDRLARAVETREARSNHRRQLCALSRARRTVRGGLTAALVAVEAFIAHDADDDDDDWARRRLLSYVASVRSACARGQGVDAARVAAGFWRTRAGRTVIQRAKRANSSRCLATSERVNEEIVMLSLT
jgi:breast cancer 2 susceptibility protein